MKIDAPSRADVIEVFDNMRVYDLIEMKAASIEDSYAEFRDDVVDRFSSGDGSFCAYLNDGTPVAVGAVIPGGEGRIQIGMFATDDFPKIAPALTKFVVRRLLPQYAAAGFSRAVCLSLGGYERAHAWLRAMGIERSADHEGVGRGGESFVEFERAI